MPNAEISIILNAVDKASGVIGSVKSKLTGLNGATSGLDNSLNKSTGLLSKLGAAASVAGGMIVAQLGIQAVAAVQQFGASSIKAFSDYEHGLAKINTIQKRTFEDMQSFGTELRDFALSTQFSMSELTESAYELNSSGVSNADTLKMLNSASDLATAGFSDLATATTALTSIINAYGYSVDDVTKISDVLLMTQNLGVTTVGQMGSSLSKVTPLAATLGIEFEEIAAAISTMTIQGISTEETMTFLLGMMNQLIKPTEDMQKLIDKYGYSSGASMLKTLGFAGTLELLSNELQGAGDDAAGMASALFGNVRALQAILALTGKNSDTYKKHLAAMFDSSGETEEAMSKMEQTYAYKIKQFSNLVNDLKIEIGGELVNSLSPFIEKLTELGEKGSFKPLISSVGDFIGSIFNATGSVGGLVASIFGFSNDAEGAIALVSTTFNSLTTTINEVASAVTSLGNHISSVVTKISEMASKARDVQRDQIDIQMQQQYVPGLGYVGPSGVVPGQKPPSMTDIMFGTQNLASVGLPTEIKTSPNLLGYDPNKLPDAVYEDSKIVDTHTNIIQENSDETKTATEKLREMKEEVKSNSKAMADGTQIVGASVRYCGDTLNSVQSLLNAANGGSGGGGGGSCRTYATGTVRSGSGNLVGGGGGASGSSGMLWYNRLGNENAGVVAAMGEKWSDTINSVTLNGCSGLVCNFTTSENTTIGGAPATVKGTFFNNGSGSFTQTKREVTMNDALITNRGDIVRFHPDDNILAFKDSSNLQSNKNINLTFNIYESKDSKEIMREIMKEINRVVRVG